MLHDFLRFFEDLSIPVTFLIVPVLLVLLQTALWDWQASKQSARRSMFFGARVGSEFISSTSADSILRTFRKRIWCLSVAIVLAYLLFSWRRSLWSVAPLPSLLILFFAPTIANLIIFGLANRQTRRVAVELPGPSTRTAALFVRDEESSALLTVLDWLGILLPIGLPLVTLSIVILCWNRFPRNYSPLTELRDAIFNCVFGIFSAGTYFALRFRARSSDWAPNPRASRRYRTSLGVMISGLFSFMIFKSSWLAVIPLLKAGSFGNMNSYFRFSSSAGVWVLLILIGLRIHARKNLARESSDPMPDYCWKWGYFYYNPNDVALIVPTRSGTGFSYNYASRSVWFVGTICVAVTVFTFVSLLVGQ